MPDGVETPAPVSTTPRWLLRMISAAQRTPILVEFENSDISIDSNYNHLYMLETVELTLQANCRLDRQQAMLVAVSGGPDSLCLLHLLWGLGYHTGCRSPGPQPETRIR